MRAWHLVCYDSSMRNSRFLPVALLAVVLSALVGGFYGSVLARQDEVTQQYRVFTAALAASSTPSATSSAAVSVGSGGSIAAP